MATLFQRRIWQKIKLIPRGRVTTYKLLAESLGKPKASRALANILKKNPKLIKIPCHRVVKSNGKVGGYVKGVKTKIKLLKKEGINIEKFKIKDFKKNLFKFK